MTHPGDDGNLTDPACQLPDEAPRTPGGIGRTAGAFDGLVSHPARDLRHIIHQYYGHGAHDLIEPLSELHDCYDTIDYINESGRHHYCPGDAPAAPGITTFGGIHRSARRWTGVVAGDVVYLYEGPSQAVRP